MRLATLLLVLLLAGLCGLPGAGPARAQAQLVEKVVRVEVPVYDDNLDDAKSRAIAQGQQEALHSLIQDLVSPEWVQLYDKELRQKVLEHPDRYISSYRVQNQEPSVDRTRFLVVLSARINRVQLTEDLHELNLPVQGDPSTSVTLLYPADDPVLSHARLRKAVRDKLSARLALLNFRVGSMAPVPQATGRLLASAAAQVPERVRALKRYTTTTCLYVEFDRAPAPAPGGSADVGAKAVALLFERASGERLANFEQQERTEALPLPVRSQQERSQLMARLVDPLIIQMQPGAIQSARIAGNKAPELRLRVSGFHSMEDEELFERAFFRRNSPFERFSLYGLAASSVTYQGPYPGDRATLEKDLTGKRIGDFSVRRADWYNDVLELYVQREVEPTHPELKLYPKEVRPPEVTQLLDDFLTKYPQLDVGDPLYAEREDNGWLSRADRLAFNATIYGYVDSRSDSDFYIGQALASGEKLTLIWNRVGRTSLTPAIRIYDANGELAATFTPHTYLRYVYTVPKGQHRFYIEIGDRFGYLKVDTGGYLNFHYLFKVERKTP